MLELALLPIVTSLALSATPVVIPFAQDGTATAPAAQAAGIPSAAELQEKVGVLFESLQKEYETLGEPTPEKMAAFQAQVAQKVDAMLVGFG